jgi:hypothetical protein
MACWTRRRLRRFGTVRSAQPAVRPSGRPPRRLPAPPGRLSLTSTCVLSAAGLNGHPMITKNHLNPEGFSGTRGFVINFSTEGVDDFLAEGKFSCGDFNPLVPFFNASRHPETNGFVMNVLVCDKPTDPDALSVGEHVDDTLAHKKRRTQFLAHTVSVMYVSVPEDMEGGELELLGPGEEVYRDGRDESDPAEALEVVSPVENMHAEFRGDRCAVCRARGRTLCSTAPPRDRSLTQVFDPHRLLRQRPSRSRIYHGDGQAARVARPGAVQGRRQLAAVPRQVQAVGEGGHGHVLRPNLAPPQDSLVNYVGRKQEGAKAIQGGRGNMWDDVDVGRPSPCVEPSHDER